MDLEAPADAWYVWFGVAIVSVAIGAMALSLPSGPPPDANAAANAVDRAAGSSHDASARYDHDATEVRIDEKRLSVRNEYGTSHASIAYGEMVPVMGHDRLENVTHGTDFEDEYEAELDAHDVDATATFLSDLADAAENNSGEWRVADGELVVRTVSVEPDTVVEISAQATDHYLDDERDDDEHYPFAQEVTFEYEGYADTWVEFVVIGTSVQNDDDEAREQVYFDEPSGQVPVDLTDATDGERGFVYGGSAMRVEAELEDGETCTTTIKDEVGELCSVDETAEEAEDRLEWIERNDDTGNYHVTLVVA